MRFVEDFKLVIATAAFLFLTVFVQITGAVSLSPSFNQLDSQSDSLISVVIFAQSDEIANQELAAAKGAIQNRQDRHSYVVKALRDNHRIAIDNLIEQLSEILGDFEYGEFWIAPVIEATVPVSAIDRLADLSSVAAIYRNDAIESIDPVDVEHRSAAKVSGISSHLNSLNIPAVWAMGITGEGSLVCNFDTGVEGIHPALALKWRGNYATSGESWFAPSSVDTLPFDNSGHGTHTMGLMLGNNEVDTFGVAPGAEWIGAAVVDQGQTLDRTIADIISAFQWAADPDGNPATFDDVPDVVLNSWGIPTTIMEPCDETFYQVIDNLEAVGTVCIFAAGNEGPGESSLRIPANRATSPLNSFAVGAIDHTTETIASFSSRGPSSCNPNAMKPEVVAPGVGIYSSYKNGDYTYKNGTSMAAPLVAGIVALLRQYNPEATVDEIKTAIIQSCVDLGPAGEDNAYGYGMPDAMKAIELMPAPPTANFVIDNQFISGDGIAAPGEAFDFYLSLQTQDLIVDSVSARLECDNGDVSILRDEAKFFFETKTIMSIASEPFQIQFSMNISNGEIIPLRLLIELPMNQGVDTIITQLMAGISFTGTILTHTTDRMQFTVSDFGKFGLGDNSILSAGGDGFLFDNSDNLLYESGLIIGRNSLQISSAVRDSLGSGYKSDFVATSFLSIDNDHFENGMTSMAEFSDTGSSIPIPISVGQRVTTFNGQGMDGVIILEFDLINKSSEYITNLYLGMLNDFDLNLSGDKIEYSENNELLIQDGGDRLVGIRPLSGWNGFVSVNNENGKLPLNNIDKFNLLSQGGFNLDESSSADFMTISNFGSFDIGPFDTVSVAMAIVVADNSNDLIVAAMAASQIYFGVTDVTDNTRLLPSGFELKQNYPNPFNPSTKISFSLSRATNVKLTVLNLLGREVAVIFDEFADAGAYDVNWDGVDHNGVAVGSGIYFYRLETENASETKKMVLVK